MAGTLHNQAGHDFRGSGSGPIDATDPWTFQFYWNGPDSSGGSSGHTYTAPIEARTVCGAGKIYVPKGAGGICALALNSTGFNPAPSWTYSSASFIAPLVYDPETGCVFGGATDGQLYKLNATTGALVASYNAGGGSLRKAVTLVGRYVYVVGFDAKLHKVHKGTMAAAWIYTPTLAAVTVPLPGMGRGSTPARYSATRDCLIYQTDDCYVHRVDNATGTNKWRVRPTTLNPGLRTLPSPTAISGSGTVVTVTVDNSAGLLQVGTRVVIVGVTPTGFNGTWTVASKTTTQFTFVASQAGSASVMGNVGVVYSANWDAGVTFERGWPVIADRHGYVLVRLQLPGIPYLQSVPTGNGRSVAWDTQAAIQSFLAANPTYQNLFVMNLDDGSAASFTPAVLYGYNEGYGADGQPVALMPTIPVVKVYPNGDEVVYIQARQGTTLANLGTTSALSQSGTTVTATIANTAQLGVPGTPYGVIRISGASPAGYNGIFVLASVVNSTQFTYTTTAGLGAVTVQGTVDIFPPDWRNDGHIVEMVLDNSTVPGLVAGQFRFMKFERYYGYTGGAAHSYINDEQPTISLHGGTVFRHHFGAIEGSHLDDRSLAHGMTSTDPMPMTRGAKTLIAIESDSAVGAPGYVPSTHYTTHNLTLGQLTGESGVDGRSWDPPGFWQYWNSLAAPMPTGEVGPEPYLATNWTYGPRDAYVSEGYLILEGSAGEIGVFTHSASVPVTSGGGLTILT